VSRPSVGPPADDRTDRLIGAAAHAFEEGFFTEVLQRLPDETRMRLDALVDAGPEGTEDAAENTRSVFSLLKSDPGRIGLASVAGEVTKMGLIRDLDLPEKLWADASPKLLARYRARAATESARELRRHTSPVRYTLLSAFCWQRRPEITDGLADLLIQIVHRVSVRAEKLVTAEMVGELQRVEGKTDLLFRIAEAALQHPDGIVRDVLFPLAGESTLAALVKESKAGSPTFRHRIQTLIHRSYGHHYRRMLPLILDTLAFRSNNSAHRPVIEALDWARAHREDRRMLVPCSEIPIAGVVRAQLREILVEDGPDGERINRIDYEICVLQVLRERLRCKEIWVEGGDRYRTPGRRPSGGLRRPSRHLLRGTGPAPGCRPIHRACNGRGATDWRLWIPTYRVTRRCAYATPASIVSSSPPWTRNRSRHGCDCSRPRSAAAGR